MADITNGLKGLTFDEVLAPARRKAGLVDHVREYGEPMPYENEPELRFRRAMKESDNEAALLSQMVNWRPSRNERMASQNQAFLSSDLSEDIGLQALGAGYGESRFDERFTTPAQLNDIEDSRARLQSDTGVLANSVAKMGVLAATTASDALVGLPVGIINLVGQTASGNIHSGREVLNALIDNPVSSYLQQINESSEEIFKNYVTDEERSRPWWENLFTANFIGDTLIKNAGFTIGAALGGRAAVGLLGKMTKANEARDAFKGLAAELGLGGKKASEVVEALAKGQTQLEKKAAVNALRASAQKLKNAELGLKIAGGLLAGSGEARIEALNGVNELQRSYDEMYGDLDMERASALSKIQDEMRRRGLDPESPAGQAFYNDAKALIDDKYVELQEQIARDKITAGNTIFALNVPLLTFGDTIEWGRLMLGDYALDRNLVKGIRKVGENTALKGAAKEGPAAVIGGTRYATKGNKFTEALTKFGAGSRNVFVEMQEEMNQSWASATAKAKAMGSTTEFMERLYDPMAVVDTVSWLDATKKGLQESWLNKDDWVEGFAGGFMGFLGLPSISVRVDENTGKRKPHVTMEGGIWSPIREHNELFRSRNALVDALNNRIQSPEFLNYYYGKIGNRHFDSIKEDAVLSGDKKKYEKADHAQLINDALMFQRAGRLQDFLDIVDSFQNVSEDDVRQIKSLFPQSAEIQSMTVPAVQKLVQTNARETKRKLDNYLRIADDVRTTFGSEGGDAFIAEMAWQTAHLDEIEHDLAEILKHTETANFLNEYKSEKGESVKDLTDYELVSSDAYKKWLQDKKADPKDTANKRELDAAISDASDAAFDMNERGKYIRNISDLSADPEMVRKRMERIQKQQEELRRLTALVNAVKSMSETSKLSEFMSAMDEIGEVSDETLKDIQREANAGNVIAQEYLTARDLESYLMEEIVKVAESNGFTPEQIRQAEKAWDYLKYNSDNIVELTKKHEASDVASDIAGPEAIDLLNQALQNAKKRKEFYSRIKPRPGKRQNPGTATADSGEGGTESAPTSGITLFKKTRTEFNRELWDKIAAELKKSGFHREGNFLRFNLRTCGFYYDGKPAAGIIFGYFPKGQVGKKGEKLPILFTADGYQIAPEEVEKITGPDGTPFTKFYLSNQFDPKGLTLLAVGTEDMAYKSFRIVAAANRAERFRLKANGLPTGPGTSLKRAGKTPATPSAGTKEQPHKFFAPSPDLALVGSDAKAVSDAINAAKIDSEVRFGMESEDGPIYILAGPTNIRIGTLPNQDGTTDVYSGMAELISRLRAEFAESSDRRDANGMWVSEKYKNHIREKSLAGFERTEENVPIKDIPGFDKIKKPIVMLVAGGEYMFSDSSVTKDDVLWKNKLQPLNDSVPYLLVPTASGKYIPVALFTQNVNGETLDLNDPKATASGFGKRLRDSIKKVSDIVTQSYKNKVTDFMKFALAGADSDADSLQNMLYMGKVGEKSIQFFIKETAPKRLQDEWFSDPDTVMVINVRTGSGENATDEYTFIQTGKESSVEDQIISALTDTLWETQSGDIHEGPTAQISTKMFEKDEDGNQKFDVASYVSDLVDAGMLLANVKDFDFEIPSFTMDYWSESQQKFISPMQDPAPASSDRLLKQGRRERKDGGFTTIEVTIYPGGVECQVQIDRVGSGLKVYKVSGGKWFSETDSKDIKAAAKKLGIPERSLIRTLRALAIIESRYGSSEIGPDRIGDRVLLRRFSGNRDAGFVITPEGGYFMSPDELYKFKKELEKKEKESSAPTQSGRGKKDIPFIVALRKLGRFDIVSSTPSEAIRQADRKRSDAKRSVTKQSPYYIALKTLLDPQKFRDYKFDFRKLKVSEELKEILLEAQETLKEYLSRDSIVAQTRVSGEEAESLANDYRAALELHRDVMQHFADEIWGEELDTEGIKYSALENEEMDVEKESDEGEEEEGTEEESETEDEEEVEDEELDVDMEISSDDILGKHVAEMARLEKIQNMRQAIEHLKKNAPQYAPFLNYVSGIGLYDSMLVELVDIVDAGNPKTVGRNKMQFREGEYTGSIQVGRNSLGYQTLMHEIVHAFTAVAVKYNSEMRGNVKSLMEYFLDTIGRNKLMNVLGFDGMYAFENEYEFVAEFFSNPKLQQLARETAAPKVEDEHGENIFTRFINFIADAIRRFLGKKAPENLYEVTEKTLLPLVDAQIALQESGKMVYKSPSEFGRAQRIATGGRVKNVAFACQLFTAPVSYSGWDEAQLESAVPVDMREKHSPYETDRLGRLLLPKDTSLTTGGMRAVLHDRNARLLRRGNSTIIGTQQVGVFVGTHCIPVFSDGSYDALVKELATSETPAVLGSSEQDVEYYKKLGLHPVNSKPVDGKIFMANSAMTQNDLHRLGITHRVFGQVLEANDTFTEDRRREYPDRLWKKMSEAEREQARECIGLW